VPTDRQRSTDELVEDARSLQRRLARALDQVDGGDPDAIRDLATYTRTLIAFGKGDGLLRRLSSAFGFPLPAVRVYELVEVGRDVRLAVGGMVSDDSTSGLEIPFEQWLTSVVVISNAGARKRTTWAQFATDYGNTFGAHAGTTIPEVLEQVVVFRGAGGHMAGYVLRAAAVVAERALGALLAHVDGVKFSSGRRSHPDGIVVTGFAIGREAPYWHGFGVSVSVAGTFEVIGMPLDDHYMRVTWEWDGGSGGGSMNFNFHADPPGQISPAAI
jgi:hypothetical protein